MLAEVEEELKQRSCLGQTRQPAITRTVSRRFSEAEEALKDCFDTAAWEVIRMSDAQRDDIDIPARYSGLNRLLCADCRTHQDCVVFFLKTNPGLLLTSRLSSRKTEASDEELKKNVRRRITKGKSHEQQ